MCSECIVDNPETNGSPIERPASLFRLTAHPPELRSLSLDVRFGNVQETFVTPTFQECQVAANRVTLLAAFGRVEVFMIQVGSHHPSCFLRKLSFVPGAQ